MATSTAPTHPPVPAPPTMQRIMISYNWETQALASLLEKLTEEGFLVWMDVKEGPEEGIKVDIVTGMTNGLEVAVLLIAILSPKYSTSKNCMLELKSAYERNIPILYLKGLGYTPSGDVRTLMNTALYYPYNVDPADGKTLKLDNVQGFLDDVAHRIPPGAPARTIPHTRILLVGCSGVGKSSLASLLINNSVLKGINPGEICVSASPTPGTWDTLEISNAQYTIIDTMGVGLGDIKVNPFGSERAILNLKDFLVRSRQGYHHIFFVHKSGRALASSVSAYKIFCEGLFPDFRGRFTLILTHHREDTIDESELKQIHENFPWLSNFVPVEIPADADEPKYRAIVMQKQAESKARVENIASIKKPKVPACSMITRHRFYYYIRELLHMIGVEWNDQMEHLMVSIGFTQEERDKTRYLL